jgi:hypothetical protein
MTSSQRWFLGTLLGLALAAAAPAAAQTADAPPSTDDPIRFTAFAVQMQAGMAKTITIAIERWTPDAERQMLLGHVSKATTKAGGQDALLEALQDIKPRCGFIRAPNTIGWDIKYAHQDVLEDGTRRIVVATDKPVSFLAVVSQARTLDYPFSLIEMRFPKGSDKGEGKLLGQSSLSTKDGRLQIEIYGQEPTRLTTITQEKRKGEK